MATESLHFPTISLAAQKKKIENWIYVSRNGIRNKTTWCNSLILVSFFPEEDV